MRLAPILLLAACTEPTWYPGLPSGVEYDTGSGDGGADGGADGGTDGGAGDGGDSGGEQLPCSTNGGAAAELSIELPGPISAFLYWRDPDCTEWSYGALPAYTVYVQQTYVGHSWAIRDSLGNLVDANVVTDTAQYWLVEK